MIHLQWQYTSGVFYEIPTKYLVPFYCFVSLDFSFWNCAQFIANAKHNRNVLVAEQWFGILNTMYCRWRDFNPGFGERLANFFSFSWLISYSILETKRLNIRINIILQRATHPVAIRQIFHVKSVARTRLIQQYCTQKHSQTHTHTSPSCNRHDEFKSIRYHAFKSSQQTNRNIICAMVNFEHWLCVCSMAVENGPNTYLEYRLETIFKN